MRSRLAALALAISSVTFASSALAQPGDIQRALDLAESRYQQASRETQQAQGAFDEAVARNRDVAANYQAAQQELKVAGRLLADADVSGPRAAEAVKREEASVEAERQRIAPQQSKLDAANAAYQGQLDRALADVPEWRQTGDRVAAARAKHDAAMQDALASLAESDPAYLELLMDSWDAEDEVRALLYTPNVTPQVVVDATTAWMASLDALDRHEADALAADARVRPLADALAQETANRSAVRDRLAGEAVPGDPELGRAAATLAAEQNAFNAVSGNVQRAQTSLDAARAELARIEAVATDARQRLVRVQKDLPLIEADLARTDAEARKAEADLAAAQKVEAMIRSDRDLIAADLAAATSYPPVVEPVYVEPSIVVVDGGTTIYYPPSKDRHHDHGRDDHSRDWDRDRDPDRDHGTRRDDGDRGTRRREGDEPRRVERDADDGRPRRPDGADDKPPAPPPPPRGGEDAATARRKQEEAKAAERQRREDAAAAASQREARERSAAAQAAAREARQRDEAARAEVESRRRQQDAEAAGRRQQQQQEQQREQRQRDSSSSASDGDRGSRYQRR